MTQTNNPVRRVIGVTRTFHWTITTGGHAVSLAGRDLTLFIVSAKGVSYNTEFTTSGNVVTFTWQGIDQLKTDKYSLVLYENYDRDAQRRVDIHDFIDLVPWGYQQTGEYSDLTEETIDLGTSDFDGEDGVSPINVIDNLESHSSTDALSANMGRELDEKKQDVLEFDNTPKEGSLNPVTSDGIWRAIHGTVNRESLTVTATANQGSVNDAVLTVKVDGQTIATGRGSLSAEIDYGVQYTIEAGDVSGYETPQSQTFTAGQPTRVVLMTYTYIVIPKETLNVTATASTGDVSSDAVITVKSNGQTLATGTGNVTVDIDYDVVYSIECSRVYDYLTPATQTFIAGQSVRNVTMAYTYIARDTITIDQTVSNELSMINGDVQGDVIKAIRAASHLYLGKQTEAGNQLICQLKDDDGTKYYDGTAAAMDGTEGDQWMKTACVLVEGNTHWHG